MLQTLWCGNVLHDQLVQVTNKELRLINAGTQQLVSAWSPPEENSIIIVNGNASQICVATNTGKVVLLLIEDGAIAEQGHVQIDGEVSCLDLTPIGMNQKSMPVCQQPSTEL